MPSDHHYRSAAGLCAAAVVLLAGAGFAGTARADLDLAETAKELRLTEGLVISDVSNWGRRSINPDSIAEAMARGTLGMPKEGDTLKRPEVMGDGERMWKGIRASEEGEFAHLPRGAYVLCSVRCEAARVVLLEASGHTMVYVNGEPHAGDPYSFGYSRIPVQLRKGANQFVFAYAGREKPLTAHLVAPVAEVIANIDDLTLPSVISNQPEDYLVGVPLINASAATRTVLVSVRPQLIDGMVREERVELAPLSVQKVALHAMLFSLKDRSDVGPTVIIRDAGAEVKGAAISQASIKLHCKSPDEPHSRTFISEMDGSVQYAAISPPAVEGRIEHPGLVVSLHGADVEAVRQAPCYAAKPDFVVVCPTNRRPYGFDWEEWGRVDAAEAMDAAKVWYHTDPRRQYLTGHSMGGHGAWQVGEMMPDRFAAVAPSAGWISFDTYASVRGEDTDNSDNQLRTIIRRAAGSADTFALMPNLRGKGIYILHGEMDDNVPVEEARKARQELTKLGIEFQSHEQAGAGHWWDDDKPGVACVDWPPIFDMFRSRTLPKPGEQREFHVRSLQSGIATMPGDGVSIVRAEHPGKVATADVKIEPATSGGAGTTGRIVVTTDNVCMLSLGEQAICDAAACPMEVDGQAVKPIRRGQHLCLVKRLGTGRWEDAGADPSFSSSLTSTWDPPRGPFKNAFTHRFVMVYATHGTAEENAWSLARARFDGEQWWYRGNGRAAMMSDDAFIRALDEGKIAGNAILYGNSDTNAAANRLTAGQAVRVSRTEATIGGRKISGDDLGVLAVGTFKGASGAQVYGLVSGTGVVGSRSTDRIPVILSGTGIPDVCVIRAGLWTRAIGGIECAGFLDKNMQAVKPDLIWRE